MPQFVLELSKGNSVSTGRAKLIWTVCMLIWVSSAIVVYCGTGSEQKLSTASALQSASGETKQAETRELKAGQVIEREIAGEGSHSYRISLKAGQYLKVVVEQKEVDVVVSLFGTDAQKVAEGDDDPATPVESVSVVAEATGDYRVEVRSKNKNVATRRYEIKVDELREATARDLDRFKAGRMFLEGDRFRAQGTAASFRQAIDKFQQSLPLWRAVEDRGKEAATLNEIGFSYSAIGDTEKALQYYNQALQLFRAVRDVKQESITLNNIAVVYSKTGELQKSLDYFSEALPLKRMVGDKRSEATTLSNIAIAYSQLGDLQKALEYHNQALPLRRIVGDQLGESTTLNSMGVVYSKMGELQKAFEYHSQGLMLVRTVGDRRNEAVTLHNIGLVYSQLGELQKALEYYDQALPLRRAVGDRSGEAYTLDSIASVYFKLGENEKALEHDKQSILLRKAVGDKYGEAYSLSNIGAVYARLGEIREAMDYFNQALRLRRTVGDRRGEAFSLQHIGAAYRDLKEMQKAQEYFSQALTIFRAIGDRNSEALILGDLARVERDLKQVNQALSHTEASLVIVESTRRAIAGQDLRASYMTTKQGLYRFYIDLLMQMHKEQPSRGHDSIALQASERARARSLLDILTEARADIRQGVDLSLLEKERSLQQNLSAKWERLTLLLGRKHTEDQEKAARKELEGLIAEYQDVQTQIRNRSPRYAALTQPKPLSLKEIQEQVLDKETLLLEYSLGDERSYLWLVGRTNISACELPKRADIESTARRVYDLLTARNQKVKFETPEKRRIRVAQADSDYWQAASALSEILLGQVKAQLGNKRLIIVADGILQYIPFGALPTPSKRTIARTGWTPLLATHEIVTLPSASTLGVLRKELADSGPAPKAVAVMADPVFDKDDERVTARKTNTLHGKVEEQTFAGRADIKIPSSELRRSVNDFGLVDSEMYFPRLPSTRGEAEAIVALTPPASSRKAVDFAASKASAVDPALGQYRFIHFATHALINSTHPELSGIVLSLVDQNGQDQDGFLLLHEILNLKLPAELVVLSSCKTGLGKDIKGEGLVGLTRGFMYAGAARVVVSLWDINDESTAELMRQLYKGMLGSQKLTAAEALRAAQLSAWKSRRWRAPYYWAAFTLQGEYK